MSRKTNSAGFLLLVVVGVFAVLSIDFNPAGLIHETSQAAERPNDWFGKQRAFPNGEIPNGRVTDAINTARGRSWTPIFDEIGILPIGAIESDATDYGETWTDISSNLPEAPINDVIVDPFRTQTLYVGTDVGVFRTNDLGGHWTTFGTGMPISVVTDLDYHPPTRMLVAGTYGRSIFKTTTEPTTRRVSPVRSKKEMIETEIRRHP